MSHKKLFPWALTQKQIRNYSPIQMRRLLKRGGFWLCTISNDGTLYHDVVIATFKASAAKNKCKKHGYNVLSIERMNSLEDYCRSVIAEAERCETAEIPKKN